jgi:hypothetical protein
MNTTPKNDQPTYAMLADMRDRALLAESKLTAVTEQRDEAISIIMQIKEQFMNGNDHYDDYHIMGNLAYDFLK